MAQIGVNHLRSPSLTVFIVAIVATLDDFPFCHELIEAILSSRGSQQFYVLFPRHATILPSLTLESEIILRLATFSC